MQPVKGYIENGRFYPIGNTIHAPGRISVILTPLEEPRGISIMEEQRIRSDWLKRLGSAIDSSLDEDFPERT